MIVPFSRLTTLTTDNLDDIVSPESPDARTSAQGLGMDDMCHLIWKVEAAESLSEPQPPENTGARASKVNLWDKVNDASTC